MPCDTQIRLGHELKQKFTVTDVRGSRTPSPGPVQIGRGGSRTYRRRRRQHMDERYHTKIFVLKHPNGP